MSTDEQDRQIANQVREIARIKREVACMESKLNFAQPVLELLSQKIAGTPLLQMVHKAETQRIHVLQCAERGGVRNAYECDDMALSDIVQMLADIQHKTEKIDAIQQQLDRCC